MATIPTRRICKPEQLLIDGFYDGGFGLFKDRCAGLDFSRVYVRSAGQSALEMSVLASPMSPVEGAFATGTASSPSSKSPMGDLDFFKNMTSEKKSTKGDFSIHTRALLQVSSALDGQPPKRRGPKPDSKPALTRRQELNRQAQR